MKVRIVLVGIGGYGGQYADALMKWEGERPWEIVGVVDPLAEKAPKFKDLKALGMGFYDNLASFYAENKADLAIISSPIEFHCAQSCEALSHGTNVLCEKPISAVVQQAYAMQEARDKSNGAFLAIGYQWSYSPQMQALKADILSGKFGAPRRMKTLALWPRNDAYYGRNNWAGCMKSASGEWILDSPVNNATAHYLHNMLYVIGPAVDRSATPASVQAELYRANPITNYDTGLLRVMTTDGVEILFYTTHAVPRFRGPEFVFEFDDATVRYMVKPSRFWAETKSGEVIEYGSPEQSVHRKLQAAIRGAQGDASAIVCGVEAALPHCLCMNGAQESVDDIVDFPANWIYKKGVPGNQVRVMAGLAELVEAGYDAWKLPGEVKPQAWTVVGKPVDLSNYRKFPSR
ncbi:MAG: Gfo/Idh/MocA family oxidoreductase [Lentisphaerae bacterium]|jgi:predicted dehydrogenase|nr:Gfo/Idh/MocA family oxidoreductase [Lentisphaerota bacterium]